MGKPQFYADVIGCRAVRLTTKSGIQWEWAYESFFVNGDEPLWHLSLMQFEHLLRREPEECLPQYAGKRVRSLMLGTALQRSAVTMSTGGRLARR